MAFLDRKTAITGIGASRFERRPEASVLDFAGEALNAALADAGLDKEQIDGLVVQVGSPRGADYDTIALTFVLSPRSAERRVGQDCVSTCSSRWSPNH